MHTGQEKKVHISIETWDEEKIITIKKNVKQEQIVGVREIRQVIVVVGCSH